QSLSFSPLPLSPHSTLFPYTTLFRSDLVTGDLPEQALLRKQRRRRRLVERLDERRDLPGLEPLAERRVTANVREEDRDRHDRASFGRALDAARADARVLPRWRVPDRLHRACVPALERGVAELASSRAWHQAEDAAARSLRQCQGALAAEDGEPAPAHRRDAVGQRFHTWIQARSRQEGEIARQSSHGRDDA